jgi:peptidoglycan/LPS O-acetylase OafA/YrhL
MHQAQPLLYEDESRSTEDTTDLGDDADIEAHRWEKSGGRSNHGAIGGIKNFMWRVTQTSLQFVVQNILTRQFLISILPKYLQPGGLKAPKNIRSTAYLDALRGYAAWAVVNHHFYWDSWFNQLPFINIVHKGRAMVDIFFIISGYVLSQKMLQLMREKKEQGLLQCLASSTFRRYIRLYFSAGVASFLSMLAVHFIPMKDPYMRPKSSFFAQLVDWMADMIHFGNPFASVPGYFYSGVLNSRYHPNLWTIPAEFRGSMVVFIFCAACCKLSTRDRQVACWILILLGYVWDAVYISLFMFGVFLADRSLTRSAPAVGSPTPAVEQPRLENERTQQRRTVRIRTYVIAGIALILGIYLCSQPEDLGLKGPEPWPHLSKAIPSWWAKGWRGREHFWLSISAGLILFALEACPILQHPFNYGFSQYIGHLSFGIYVMHIMILHTLWDGPLTRFRQTFLGSSWWCYCMIYVPYFMTVMWAADYFIRLDRHVISIGRWLEKKTFKY